jgi:hypothetical protein
MMKKTSLLMAFLLLGIMFAMPIPLKASPMPQFFIEPAYFDGDTSSATPPTLAVGQTFTVRVKLKNFENVNTIEVGIGYDRNKLQVMDFRFIKDLKPNSIWYRFGFADADILELKGANFDDKGAISISGSSLTGGRSVADLTGQSYLIMEIDFKVRGNTDGDPTTLDCMIHLGELWEMKDGILIHANLIDPSGNNIECERVDGQIETVPPPLPHGPEIVDFTWLPTIPFVEDVVTFTANALPAYDGTNYVDITEYRWDFTGDGVADKIVSVPQTTWTFHVDGDINVTLEVFAPVGGGIPQTDTLTKIVHVEPRPAGAYIDLWADDYSIGLNQPGDAHAPQDLVTLWAKVTYNDDPVGNKLVAFEVKDSHGDSVLFRTAITNDDGICFIEFRIPNSPAFGTWTAIATVEVAGQVKYDIMPFEVGWIIQILSVKLTDQYGNTLTSIVEGTTAYFNVTVLNIAKGSRNATITVTVYDDCNQTIGVFVIEDQRFIPGTSIINEDIISILIPTWSFVGKGKAFANAFTALPINHGVPWCPEAYTEFIIQKD